MKRQYLITERAHFMCPNMHFGMLADIDKEFNPQRIEDTLNRMAKAHPFLRSLIAYEDDTDKLYYKITDKSQIKIDIRNSTDTLWNDYEMISKKDWNVFENGMLKVFIYPKEQGMTLLFVAHHLLTDGRGLRDLVVEFANDYVKNIEPAFVKEQLLESIDDLPPNSRLSGISKLLIKQANSQWKKEKHTVSYETYQSFVEDYSKQHIVKYESYEFSKEELEEIRQLSKDNGFTINDYLMADMYIKTGAKKIIIAVDIRKQFKRYNEGALGNYATAMGIQCKSKTTDIVKKAKQVHKLVQKHMKKNQALMLVLACYFDIEPTLLDAAAISGLGGFNSKAGKFVGDGMFGFGNPSSYSITNLGKITNENIKSLMFIPPASPAAKLTLGVITLNGVMRACSSKNEK